MANSSNGEADEGFTLVELMVVVAVIGLLAAIAVPKMGGLITKSKHAAILSKLAALRSAISIYYGDNEERPMMLESLQPKYLSQIPPFEIPGIPAKNTPKHNTSTFICNYPTAVALVLSREVSNPPRSSYMYFPPGCTIPTYSGIPPKTDLQIFCIHNAVDSGIYWEK